MAPREISGSGRPASRLGARLDDRRLRRFVYLGFCVALVPIVLFFFSRNGSNYVNSDGKWYYVYLPSWVMTGDLDFEDEIRAHFGAELGDRMLDNFTPTGLVRNKYPIGLALTISFPFAAAHGAMLGMESLGGQDRWPLDGYSPPYQLAAVLFVLFLGAATMMLIDEILTGFFRLPGWIAVLAILSCVGGSSYLYYLFREPFMVHIVSTFWCTAFVVLTLRAARPVAGARRLLLHAELGFCLAMALISRPTNLIFAVFLVPLFLATGRRDARASMANLVPLALGAVLPLALQAGAWQILFGTPLVYSYGGEGFRWASPSLWQTLFSPRHGLFLWAPLLLLAAHGVVAALRRAGREEKQLLLCWIGAFLALWYLNSAWHMWWFGGSFGARAFLEMTGLFAIGLAFAYRRAFESPRRGVRALLAGFVVLCLGYNAVLIYLYGYSIIDRNGPLF